MDESKKIYSLKPAKKFFQIRFLFLSILLVLLIFLQTIISLTSPFYLYLGVFLIPLSGILIYVFYIYYYKNPLQVTIRLEGLILFFNNSSRNKQNKTAFKLDPNRINNILIHQALLDKILNLKTISLKIMLKNNYQLSIPHVFFNKNAVLFLKMLFKGTDLEKKQLEIDLKMNPGFIKVLSKIIQ